VCALALAVLGALLLATGAAATPDLRFKASFVPIAGYPETGNIYGAGAALRLEYEITGNEYEGSPPPATAIRLKLPRGVRVHAGVPTCPTATLEAEVASCPRGSHAGPSGSALLAATLEHKRQHLPASAEAFYVPGGGLGLLLAAPPPGGAAIFGHGMYTSLLGAAGFGPELHVELPLVSPLPGAPATSIESLEVQLGSASGPKVPRRAVYHYRVPLGGCPAGGFRFATELVFDDPAGPPQVLTREYRAPCPRRRVVRPAPPPPPLSGLTVNPLRFRAARSGASVARGPIGATVDYTVSEAAAGAGEPTVTFTVERVLPGVEHEGECLATGPGRPGPSCSRYGHVHGSFGLESPAGGNSFEFTGRIGGRTLRPGVYVLRAKLGTATEISEPFRIVR
jgi:hypothetical protein